MEKIVEDLVKQLRKRKETIAFMESCTGGMLASEITNVEKASEVLKVSLITYSNEFKEKFGVDAKVIKQYTVYSIETAMEMAKSVSEFADSDWGIGITGQLGRMDPNNPGKTTNEVYYSAYNRKKENYYTDKIVVMGALRRKQQKEEVSKEIVQKVLKLVK